MKKKIIVILLAVLMCLTLVACGDKKKGAESSKNVTTTKASTEVEADETDEPEATENQVSAEIEETSPADNYYLDALPKNVKIVYETYIPFQNNGYVNEYIKIGNDLLKMDVSTTGKDMTRANNYAWHYYKYKGDGLWDDYYTNGKEDWRLYREDIGADNTNPLLLTGIIQDDDTRYIDKATDTHEKITIEGLGEVDTVILDKLDQNGKGKMWYCEKIHMYVKTDPENDGNRFTMTVYDTSVKDFGMEVPK
ncbi:MAG: hypothetical protein IKT04_05075 [Clostridia bacterium]|nr:hypothetical protein [Clostridia bacterium]MBR6479856.1 hypothetical protein [Clostridia bacterium]